MLFWGFGFHGDVDDDGAEDLIFGAVYDDLVDGAEEDVAEEVVVFGLEAGGDTLREQFDLGRGVGASTALRSALHGMNLRLEVGFLSFEICEFIEHGFAVPTFGDGGGDVGDGAAEGGNLSLQVFDDSFVFRGEICVALHIGFEEGGEVFRMFEEG